MVHIKIAPSINLAQHCTDVQTANAKNYCKIIAINGNAQIFDGFTGSAASRHAQLWRMKLPLATFFCHVIIGYAFSQLALPPRAPPLLGCCLG